MNKHKWNSNGICERCDISCEKIISSLDEVDSLIAQSNSFEPDSDECKIIISKISSFLYEKHPCLTDEEFMIKDLIK